MCGCLFRSSLSFSSPASSWSSWNCIRALFSMRGCAVREVDRPRRVWRGSEVVHLARSPRGLTSRVPLSPRVEHDSTQPTMRPSPSLLSGSAIPRYRSPALSSRLPPPKLPLFRSVVAHPPAPFAVEAHARAKDAAAAEVTGSHTQGTKAEGKGKASTKAKANKVRRPLSLSLARARAVRASTGQTCAS